MRDLTYGQCGNYICSSHLCIKVFALFLPAVLEPKCFSELISKTSAQWQGAVDFSNNTDLNYSLYHRGAQCNKSLCIYTRTCMYWCWPACRATGHLWSSSVHPYHHLSECRRLQLLIWPWPTSPGEALKKIPNLSLFPASLGLCWLRPCDHFNCPFLQWDSRAVNQSVIQRLR